MNISPFLKSLKTDKIDIFKTVIVDFKQLNRVKFSIASTAYESVKTTTEEIEKVWNGKRMRDSKALKLFTTAIRKLNLFMRQLRDLGHEAKASILEALEQKLIALLPDNIPAQLELFEVEVFETGNKESLFSVSFRDWKRETLYRNMRQLREAVCQQAYQDEQTKLKRLRAAY